MHNLHVTAPILHALQYSSPHTNELAHTIAHKQDADQWTQFLTTLPFKQSIPLYIALIEKLLHQMLDASRTLPDTNHKQIQMLTQTHIISTLTTYK